MRILRVDFLPEEQEAELEELRKARDFYAQSPDGQYDELVCEVLIKILIAASRERL